MALIFITAVLKIVQQGLARGQKETAQADTRNNKLKSSREF